MKSLTGISQSFAKCIKATIFAERLPMTASALKHDHDIIIIKSAESLKIF